MLREGLIARGKTVIRQPDHPVKPAFEKATDWAAHQEQMLTDAQRRVFDGIKDRQAKEKKQSEEKLANIREQLREMAKAKKLEAELKLKPPYRVNDPHIRQLGRRMMKAEKEIADLARGHDGERRKALKAFEQERNKDKKKGELQSSWNKAVVEAASKEAERNRDRDLSDDFNKVR